MKRVKGCRIAEMLRSQKKHISFHTPGHKRAGADITELSYSDNLLSPSGVIAEAERDIAEILGAERSFILTDGSTCGVYAMLAALKSAGVKRIAVPVYSHVSVKNACAVLGLDLIKIEQERRAFPIQPTIEQIETALLNADALLLTSPDYYGYFPPLTAAKELCRKEGKPFVIDGAHGGHLHFTEIYAGRYADMWVDGVHKSLPALTQGAVVSASAEWSARLGESVKLFRTTSPSYPVMASVEYAVKYPRNLSIERSARELKSAIGAAANDDWSKLLIPFGENADSVQEYLERKGVYAEFNDGNYLMFYLSPCTSKRELKTLARLVKNLPRGEMREATAEQGKKGKVSRYVPLSEAAGRTCAKDCGIFPPCIPLIAAGEKITERAAARLDRAKNTFGLKDGKIAVFAEE